MTELNPNDVETRKVKEVKVKKKSLPDNLME